MEALPAIFLLVILNPVWARVPPQDPNEIKTNVKEDNLQETINGNKTTQSTEEAIPNNSTFNATEFKVPEDFYPENDRDAIPVGESLMRSYNILKTLIQPVMRSPQNTEGSPFEEEEQATGPGHLGTILHNTVGSSDDKNSTLIPEGMIDTELLQVITKLLLGNFLNTALRTVLASFGILM